MQAAPLSLMVVGVRRAYFYAKAQRPVFIEIPPGDFCEGREQYVAQLAMSLCGARDAGLNWSKEVANAMREMGFARGKACTCAYHYVDKALSAIVHGDDFLVVGPDESLLWPEEKSNEGLEWKV